MRSRLLPLVALSPLLGAGICNPPNPGPPDQPGDCKAGGTLAAEPGTGLEAFVPLAKDAETGLNFGAQGGMHVWVSVKAAGFGDAKVDVSWTATDTFTGHVLGSGSAAQVPLNALEGEPAGTCDYHGVPLFLSSRFNGSGGLAKLEVTVKAPDGRSATGSQEVWLGSAMPACLPSDAPVLAPRNVRVYRAPEEPPAEIHDGDTLVAEQLGTGETNIAVGALTNGFAGSAVTVRAELRDPDNVDHVYAYGEFAPNDYDPPPAQTKETTPRCVPFANAAITVDPTLDGKEAILAVKADDGHGHAQEVTRKVTLQRRPLTQP